MPPHYWQVPARYSEGPLFCPSVF